LRARPLREAQARELRPLLDEEAALWYSELGWDFTEVRAAVSGGIERGTLPGRVVAVGSRAVAYSYYMVDPSRVIVGSIFATRAMRGQGLEEELVDAVIEEARAEHAAGRVECQTLFCTATGADGRFVSKGFASRARHYMRRELDAPVPEPKPLPQGIVLRPLKREDLPAAAEIIYTSHQRSVDAALNMTYATPSTCRAFVDTLVVRSGCGQFDAEASRFACGPRGPLGVLIASRLSRANGHVCQVSVNPAAQGSGLGGALVARALQAFRGQGLASATLSVTASNERAHRLYERLGFSVQRAFGAHAWVRPPAAIELSA
jgi:ribosomal protein S18 acetylase RimI-like enzyme